MAFLMLACNALSHRLTDVKEKFGQIIEATNVGLLNH